MYNIQRPAKMSVNIAKQDQCSNKGRNFAFCRCRAYCQAENSITVDIQKALPNAEASVNNRTFCKRAECGTSKSL